MIIAIGRDKTSSVFNVCRVEGQKVTPIQLTAQNFFNLLKREVCENYTISSGVVEYTQGSESNLPDLNTIGFFVLARVVNGDEKHYRILDTRTMAVSQLSERDTIRLKNERGIVNAKVTTVGDSKIISSLGGSFLEIDGSKPVPRVLVGAPTKTVDAPTNTVEKDPQRVAEEAARRYLSMPVSDLTKEYGSTNKMKYIESRAKKGTFAKTIKKALAVGLIAATMMSLTTACSTVSVDYTTPTASAYTQVEVSNKIEDATTITLRSHKMSLSKGVDVIIDGEKLGTVEGEFLHLLDTLNFKDLEGTVLATSGEKLDFLKTDWGVVDGEGNPLYQAESKAFSIRNVNYKLFDSDGEEVGTMKSNLLDFANGEIKDTEGNVIAEIEGNILNKNLKITIKQKDKIDNKSLILLATTFTYDQSKNNKSSSSSSSKSK